MNNLRSLLAFAVQNKLIIHQMDVTTAFLHGCLEEDIYMEQPPGYIKEGQESFVCLYPTGFATSVDAYDVMFRDVARPGLVGAEAPKRNPSPPTQMSFSP